MLNGDGKRRKISEWRLGDKLANGWKWNVPSMSSIRSKSKYKHLSLEKDFARSSRLSLALMVMTVTSDSFVSSCNVYLIGSDCVSRRSFRKSQFKWKKISKCQQKSSDDIETDKLF